MVTDTLRAAFERHQPCELCGAQPEVIYGPDYRFGKYPVQSVSYVYTAQCGASACYTGHQFSSFTAAKALDMWDRYREAEIAARAAAEIGAAIGGAK